MEVDSVSSSSKIKEEEMITTTAGENQTRRRCWDEAFEDDSSGDNCLEQNVSNGSNADQNNVSSTNKCVEQLDEMDSTDGSKDSKGHDHETPKFVCDAHPGCAKSFSCVEALEEHYNLRHKYKCSVCKKSLPSDHILELHVLEAHDTLFSLMAERKPMFSCFLETCAVKLNSPSDRKTHCLQEHSFPKSFRLWNLTFIKAPGQKGHYSKNKGTRQQNQEKDSKPNSGLNEAVSNGTNSIKMETDDEKSKGLKNTSNSNNNIPRKPPPVHFTFGQSASRVFKPKYTFGMDKAVRQKTTSEASQSMDLSDMEKVLPATTT